MPHGSRHNVAANHCVLVVEDNPDIRDAEAAILESAGYVVISAVDGAEALETLRAGCRPSLIILDLTMPVMDGVEFCCECQKDAALRAIPVLLVTAVPLGDPRIARTGAGAILSKPFGPGALIDAVANFCPPACAEVA